MLRLNLWLGGFVGLALLSGCGGEEPRPAETVTPSPIVGTWQLDREAFIDSYLQMAFRELEEGRKNGLVAEEAYQSMAAQIREQTNEKFGAMHARFVFAANGTFEADGSSGTASGTWTLEGSTLDVEIKRQDGQDLLKPIHWPARYEDESIVLRPEAAKNYEMTLRRGE